MKHSVAKANMIFLITVLVSLCASFLPISKMFPDYAMRLLFSEIILVAPGAAYLLSGHQNYFRAVRMKKLRPSTVMWLILFTVCISPVMSLVNAISMLFVENSTADTMNTIVTAHSYPVSMLLIAFLPALFEESIYRGMFFDEYRKVSVPRGILLSAFLFGIMHGNFNQFSYAFLMGIVFALVIEATDSILSSMIIHFLVNGSSVTLLTLASRLEQSKLVPDGFMEEAMEQTTNHEALLTIIRSYVPFAVIGAVFAVVVFRLIAANEGRLEHINQIFRVQRSGERGRLLTVPLIVGIVICVGLMILNELPVPAR